MRFDTEVYFQRITSTYNANTGDYEDSIEETKKYADVTDSGVNTMRLVYGAIKQGSVTIRLQNQHTMPFDRIRIGNKQYSVDMERKLCRMHIFVASEVQ